MISLGGYMDNIKVVVSPVIKQDGRQKIFISFIDEEDKREAFQMKNLMNSGNFLKMNREIY